MPTPLPYCATAPERFKLVWTRTFAPLPAGSRRKTEAALSAAAAFCVGALGGHSGGIFAVIDIFEFHDAREGRNATGPSRTLILPL